MRKIRAFSDLYNSTEELNRWQENHPKANIIEVHTCIECHTFGDIPQRLDKTTIVIVYEEEL